MRCLFERRRGHGRLRFARGVNRRKSFAPEIQVDVDGMNQLSDLSFFFGRRRTHTLVTVCQQPFLFPYQLERR